MKKIISFAALIVALTAPTVSFAINYVSLKSSMDYTKATYDIQFLDTMIAHELQGIEMSKMVIKNSQTKEIRDKAQAMIDEQQSGIAEMQTLRDEIGEGSTVAINVNFNGMDSVDFKDLATQSPKTFDQRFLQLALKHREGGKIMANDASQKAKSSKIKELAEKLVIRESGEVAELAEMLKRQK